MEEIHSLQTFYFAQFLKFSDFATSFHSSKVFILDDTNNK